MKKLTCDRLTTRLALYAHEVELHPIPNSWGLI